MSPKLVLFVISGFALALGFLSAAVPKRSIGLYQWIMECFNWKVTPIDELREVRNTRFLGAVLLALSFAIIFITFSRF